MIAAPNAEALRVARRKNRARSRRRFVFVGECRSLTAIENNWTWTDGRLAAKPLFEALDAMNVEPRAQSFTNLFQDPPRAHLLNNGTIAELRATKLVVIAMGKRVSAQLGELEIDHIAIVHPAARGKIRKRERYIEHVIGALS